MGVSLPQRNQVNHLQSEMCKLTLDEWDLGGWEMDNIPKELCGFMELIEEIEEFEDTESLGKSSHYWISLSCEDILKKEEET